MTRRVFPLLFCLGLLLLNAGCASRTVLPESTRSMQTALPSSAEQLSAKVLATAKTQVGRPYIYGGSSPERGFDCSGLIWWAYRMNGIAVPRTAREQAAIGVNIARKDMRPGDIVVFKTGRHAGSMHTALYAGQGRFLHSPRKRSRVRLDKLDNPYWRSHFVSVRRVIR